VAPAPSLYLTVMTLIVRLQIHDISWGIEVRE